MNSCAKYTWRIAAIAALAASVLAGSARADLETENFVLGPTNPGKWGNPVMGTSGGVVTWSLIPTGVVNTAEGAGPNTHLASFMPAGYHAAIEAAFAAWSAVADIQFVEVADSGLPFNQPGATGDIRIGGHFFDGAGGTLAHGFFPPNNGASAAGDIHFDTGDAWDTAWDGGANGFNIFQVMAHEIGHAIGLSHTGVPGSLMNPFYTEAFQGLQADDIAGAQFIYGPAPERGVPDGGSTLLLLGAGLMAFATLRRKAA